MVLSTTFTQFAPETTKFRKITLNKGHFAVQVGPPVPVSRYTEYRDTATNLSGINTGIEVTQYRYGRY